MNELEKELLDFKKRINAELDLLIQKVRNAENVREQNKLPFLPSLSFEDLPPLQ